MIGEYRFFQEFFDGQIVQKESEQYKMFKILLFSCFSVIAIFLTLGGWCSPWALALIELGMVWNFYVGLSKKFSYVLSVLVAFIYFYFCSQYKIFANALIYIACYIPLQLIATGKDYCEGDFVQIKKKITDLNKILFVIFFIILFVFLYVMDYDFGSRFILFDVLSATLLVCSALLRNERYLEYYIFRVFALVSSIILWLLVALEYNSLDSVMIVIMYLAYLMYDVSTFIFQKKTYVNQYMVHMEQFSKIEDEKLVDEKLKKYKSAKNAE